MGEPISSPDLLTENAPFLQSPQLFYRADHLHFSTMSLGVLVVTL
jgi:hypothetical protein